MKKITKVFIPVILFVVSGCTSPSDNKSGNLSWLAIASKTEAECLPLSTCVGLQRKKYANTEKGECIKAEELPW